MTFHIPFEEAIVAGFLIWLGISVLYTFGKFLGELAWSVVITAYHHIYFRIWAWRTRPRKVNPKRRNTI